MANDFITMVNRITTELRRSTMTDEAKAAINDAIEEAGKTRFYFNEVRGQSFSTVVDQEYYPDMGLVEVDTLYYIQGNARYEIFERHNDVVNDIGVFSAGGPPDIYSRAEESLRVYPIPRTVMTLYMDGFTKLTPWPLVADGDSNAWTISGKGERYIRALAKSILLKDVIRDYREASVLELIAEDLKNQLTDELADRRSTGVVTSTQF